MKKSRKFLLGTVSALFCAFAAFGLAACENEKTSGTEGEPPAHEHTWNEGVAVGVTCTTDGTTLYTCTTCGEFKSVPTEKTGHNFSTTYSKDTEEHWLECVNHGCDEKSEAVEHEFADTLSFNAEKHWRECVCGAKSESAEHTYKAGVYEKDDGYHWQRCDCGNTMEKTEHGYPASWAKDDEYHWHTCACGNEEKGAHTFVNDICTQENCGYELIYSKGLSYGLLNDGTYAVTGAGTWEVSETLIIPAVYEGKPVTKVKESAFSGSSLLTAVKTVVLGKNVTEIERDAFRCGALESIVFNDKLEIIGDDAFSASPAITSLDFPLGLKSIGNSAFRKFTGLKTLVLPEGLETIGKDVFEDCTALTKVSVPNTIKEINRYSFSGCAKSIYTIDGNGNYYLGNVENPYAALIMGSLTIRSLVLPEGTRTIASGAFYLFNNNRGFDVESADFDNVRHIGKDAFYGCKNLKTVKFGKDLETIGTRAFRECALTEAKIPEKVTRIEEDTFGECAITEVTIPSTVKFLGYYAFGKCALLKKVTFEEGLEEMGDAFFNCDALTGATLPKSLKKASHLFSSCDNFAFNIWENGKYVGTADNPYYLFAEMIDGNVSSFVLHDDTRIVGGGFYKNTLVSLTMGKNVIYIGKGVFNACKNLTDIYYKGTQEEFERIAVSDKNNPKFYTATVHYNSTGTL